jgi:hypothetical protein
MGTVFTKKYVKAIPAGRHDEREDRHEHDGQLEREIRGADGGRLTRCLQDERRAPSRGRDDEIRRRTEETGGAEREPHEHDEREGDDPGAKDGVGGAFPWKDASHDPAGRQADCRAEQPERDVTPDGAETEVPAEREVRDREHGQRRRGVFDHARQA